jgi:hypothetical protein
MNSLLSGGIGFHPASKKSTEAVKFKLSQPLDAEDEAERRFMSLAYSEFCRSVYRNQIAVGFAAVIIIPHVKYTGVPVVLDLQKCEIRFRRDVATECHFRFFEKIEPAVGPVSSSGSAGQMFIGLGHGMSIEADINRREIHGVVVFVSDKPNRNGTFTSKMTLLKADIKFESDLRSACSIADKYLCNPPLVTSFIEEKLDPKALTITDQTVVGGYRQHQQYRSLFPGNGEYEGPMRTSQLRMDQQSFEINPLHNEMSTRFFLEGTEGHDAYMRRYGLYKGGLLPHQQQQQNQPEGGKLKFQEYQLSLNRSLEKQNLPQSPHDALIAWRTARTERVLAIMSVPMAMISQQSALGGKTAMNENAFLVFMTAQKQLKQQLLQYIHVIYHGLYDYQNGMNYLIKQLKKMKSDPSEKPTKAGLEKSKECEITMPGIPPENVMHDLFLKGVLKFEAFRYYLNEKHAIPLDHFNTSLPLTYQELNQLKPPEEKGSSE